MDCPTFTVGNYELTYPLLLTNVMWNCNVDVSLSKLKENRKIMENSQTKWLVHSLEDSMTEEKLEPKYQALDLNNKGNEFCITAKYNQAICQSQYNQAL